jgi:hypothetical protein
VRFRMRRFTGNINGEQYLASTSGGRKVVHDLDPEMVECQIDDVIHAGNVQPFTSQSDANAAGFENCEHCIEPLHQVRQRQRLLGVT